MVICDLHAGVYVHTCYRAYARRSGPGRQLLEIASWRSAADSKRRKIASTPKSVRIELVRGTPRRGPAPPSCKRWSRKRLVWIMSMWKRYESRGVDG